MVEVSKLNGVKVITADSYTLGEVDGMMVDTRQWKVTHHSVRLYEESTRELGFRKPLLGSVKICVPIEQIAGYGNVITLNKSLQELRNSPECKGRE